MYSRNQATDEGKIIIPENYDGTAFMEKPSDPQRENPERTIKVLGAPSADAKVSPIMPPPSEMKSDDIDEEEEKEKSESVGLSGFLEKIPFAGIFKKGEKYVGKLGLGMPRFGTEEILIIAMALFLFFSKEGDKECAIMLGLLLLVSN